MTSLKSITTGVAAALTVAAGTVIISPPAEAARVCGDRDAILKTLEQRHEETPLAIALTSGGAVLEVLIAQDGGWTIIVSPPRQPTCIVAVGEAWEFLHKLGIGA
ncbi:MAG: hypothetical protein ACRDI2_05305 [Chloroflexota bacterium]